MMAKSRVLVVVMRPRPVVVLTYRWNGTMSQAIPSSVSSVGLFLARSLSLSAATMRSMAIGSVVITNTRDWASVVVDAIAGSRRLATSNRRDELLGSLKKT